MVQYQRGTCCCTVNTPCLHSPQTQASLWCSARALCLCHLRWASSLLYAPTLHYAKPQAERRLSMLQYLPAGCSWLRSWYSVMSAWACRKCCRPVSDNPGKQPSTHSCQMSQEPCSSAHVPQLQVKRCVKALIAFLWAAEKPCTHRGQAPEGWCHLFLYKCFCVYTSLV